MWLPLALLLLVAVVYSVTRIATVVDTWDTLASGRHILHHGLYDSDPFSFAVPSPAEDATPRGRSLPARVLGWLHPSGWIDQHWLSCVLLAKLVEVAGLGSLVTWKVLNYLAVGVLLVLAARVRHAPPTVAVLVSAAALVAGRTFFEMRAQDISNLLTAGFFLLVALAHRRDERWHWLHLPLIALWCNVHLGFIYPMSMLFLMVAGHWAARARGGPWLSFSRRGLRTAALVAAAAPLLCAVTSPFRFAILTRPLRWALGTEASEWRLPAEWAPLWTQPPARVAPLLALMAAATIAGVLALRQSVREARRSGGVPQPTAGPGRSFDITAALLVSATLAMTIRSIRFAPLLCMASAPMLAEWLGVLVTAARGSKKWEAAPRKRLKVAGRVALWVAAAVAVMAISVRVHRTFLAPWPLDAQRTSTFDRLSHSYSRPWGVCEFLSANALEGRMWTFWREGVFFSWCSEPDPGTGEIAVKHLLDIRGQAVYGTTALRTYLAIRDGGPSAQAAVTAGRALEPGEFDQARRWVRAELSRLGIWLAHFPPEEQLSVVSQAVFSLETWQPVYLDERHTLYADLTTTQGAALYAGVRSGLTRFPDRPTSNLTRMRALLRGEKEEDLLEVVALARETCSLRPSPRSVKIAVRAARIPVVRRATASWCRDLLDEFVSTRDATAAHDGFFQHLATAVEAATFLRDLARDSGDAATAAAMEDRIRALGRERERIEQLVLW